MIIRLFNTLRAFSVFLLLVVFLFIYANLPEQVGISSDEYGRPEELLARDTFFYSGLLFFTLMNGIFLMLIRLYKRTSIPDEAFKQAMLIWLNGLVSILNLFFMVALVFINAFNSLEKIEIGNFGITIIGAGGLLVAWLLGYSVVWFQRGK